MRTIHKFQLTADDTPIQMPKGAQILCVQAQHNKPYIWALVNPNNPMEQRKFVTIGTGWEIDGDPGTYIGTFQRDNGGLVFHVFEVDL